MRTSGPAALAPDREAGDGRLEIDWELAGRWAGRLASPGPTPSREELVAVVARLRAAAERARPLARRAARLSGALAAAGRADQRAEVLVVDRPGWAVAAARSFEGLVPASLTGPAPGSSRSWAHRLRAPAAQVKGAPGTAQVAGLLALLSSRVLGQFDPFAVTGPPGGRLVLVAPNVLRIGHGLSADADDFALWVCVHEQTHALQFAAAPWLADHLRTEVGALVQDLARSAGDELAAAIEGALRAVRGNDELGLLGAVLDEGQRGRVDRITAVMSLLEGHADVTMDAVGPRAIPSVRRLRTRFEARRRRATGIDRVLRRLLGMDAKLAQYRRGAAFVREVRTEAGRMALDPVWTGPELLPTPREIADPLAWVRRVHG